MMTWVSLRMRYLEILRSKKESGLSRSLCQIDAVVCVGKEVNGNDAMLILAMSAIMLDIIYWEIMQ